MEENEEIYYIEVNGVKRRGVKKECECGKIYKIESRKPHKLGIA